MWSSFSCPLLLSCCWIALLQSSNHQVNGFSLPSIIQKNNVVLPPRQTTTRTTALSMGLGSKMGGRSGMKLSRTRVYDEDEELLQEEEEEDEERKSKLTRFFRSSSSNSKTINGSTSSSDAKTNGDAAAETNGSSSDSEPDAPEDDPAPPAPVFSDKKTQIRLDGLEPYVLVSAITATASFDVVTGGNLFDNSPIFANGDGSLWDDILRGVLLLANTTSSCLGLYALGVFSFCIMYSKAALARDDDFSQPAYQTFFKFTASYRYKGYLAFLWSLTLFVCDLFLFAIAYLPESIRPFAIVAAVPAVYACWSDWQAIVKEASIIYAPSEQIAAKMKEDAEN